jgi:hypothetical protein
LPPTPRGPSEFTRIVSSPAPAPTPQPEPPLASPDGGAGRFAVPAIPQMPSAPQVPGMQAPQVPGMQMPQIPVMQTPAMPGVAAPQLSPMGMPQMPAPSMPQIPQAPAPMPKADGSAPAGKVSYLPLIIIFNVLFIVAVLIVLYFAFKH